MLLGWLVYAFAHATAYTIDPADLKVYNDGGLIVRHVSPPYDAQFQYPLYDWPLSKVALRFTYTPFAAPLLPRHLLHPVGGPAEAVSGGEPATASAAAWFTMDGLSYLPGGRPPEAPRCPCDLGLKAQKTRRIRPFRADSCSPGGATPRTGRDGGALPVPSDDLPGGIARPYRAGGLDWRVKLGGALLGRAAALLTEPVFRTMYLGQINLLLMALIIGDLRRPGDRPLKGAATGIAAGIKLVPLVFIRTCC